MPKQHDPLLPLESVVTIVGCLFVILLVLSAVLFVIGQGSFGDDAPCVDYSTRSFNINFGGQTGSRPLVDFPQAAPLKGSSTHTTRLESCTSHPSTTFRIVAEVRSWIDLIYFALAMLLLRSLIRTARRRGLFTDAVATKVSRLGWVVLIGTITLSVAKAVLDASLVHMIVAADFGTALVGAFGLSLTSIFVGFGLLTLGRVLRQAVVMREDADATV